MSNDPIVQSHYTHGVDYSSASAAGRSQAAYNPSYTPPQQYNETAADYSNRVAAQRAAT